MRSSPFVQDEAVGPDEVEVVGDERVERRRVAIELSCDPTGAEVVDPGRRSRS
jgi:hypothetical protein